MLEDGRQMSEDVFLHLISGWGIERLSVYNQFLVLHAEEEWVLT